METDTATICESVSCGDRVVSHDEAVVTCDVRGFVYTKVTSVMGESGMSIIAYCVVIAVT